MAAQLLAYILLGVHFLVLGYLIFGGFAAWKWPGALFAHIPLVAWAIVSSIFPLACPLTEAENGLRQAGGLLPYTQGFVETYLAGVLYDPHHVNRFRAVIGLLVVVSWLGAWWYAHRRRAVRRLLDSAPPNSSRLPVN